MKSEERIKSIDLLKGLMILMVIVNHTNVLGKRNLVFLLVVNPAVPVFIMLSSFVFAREN